MKGREENIYFMDQYPLGFYGRLCLHAVFAIGDASTCQPHSNNASKPMIAGS